MYVDKSTIQAKINSVKEVFPFPDIYNTARYENIVTHISKVLPLGASILDLGAGPCEIPAILNQLGYNCTAYDDFQDEWLIKNNEEGRQKVFTFAEQMNVKIEIATSYTLPFAANSFDMFMMNDVLEHIHDSPKELLNSAVNSVKPGGYIFVTVPSVVNLRKRISVLLGRTNLPDYETFYWYPGKWRGPVREYTRGDLEKMCSYLQVDVVELKGCHHMLDRVPNSIRGIYKGVTSIFPDWRDTWLLVAQKPKNWQPRLSLSKTEFKEIMKRTQKKHRKEGKLL